MQLIRQRRDYDQIEGDCSPCVIKARFSPPSDMRLSVHLVHQGRYVKAGDELPSDFVLPEHLDRFVVYDDPPQTSRADLRFSSAFVEGQQGDFGAGTRLAKPAMDYPKGEEEFIPRPKPTKGMKMGEEIRRAHQRKGNEDYEIVLQFDSQRRTGEAERVLHGWKFNSGRTRPRPRQAVPDQRERKAASWNENSWSGRPWSQSAKRRKSARRQRSVGRRVSVKTRPLISYCPVGLGKLGKRIVETEAVCSRCGNISTATSKP